MKILSATQQSTVNDDSSFMAKVEKLSALHAFVENCLGPLLMVADKCHPTVTKIKQRVFQDLIFSSYIANLPETEDHLGLDRDFQTFSPSQIRFANGSIFR